MRSKIFYSTFILSLAALFAACGKKSSSSGTFSAPPLTPIVKSSLPSTLGGTGGSSISLHSLGLHNLSGSTPTPANTSNSGVAAEYLWLFFNEQYSGSDGSNSTGYLVTQVGVIDGKMSGINNQVKTMGQAPACLSQTAGSYTVDVSAIDPMLKMTLNSLQCYQASSTSDTGGQAFGQNGVNYSLYNVMVNSLTSGATFSNTGGFIQVANLTNSGSTDATNPETLDAMTYTYSAPSSSDAAGAMSILRFKAVPSTNTFEMYFAANDSGGLIGTGAATATGEPHHGINNMPLLCGGFRMNSDGKHIYAEGLIMDDGNNGTQGMTGSWTWKKFNVCLTASTLAVDTTVSDCDTLYNSFTISTSASLNMTELTGETVVLGGQNPPQGPGASPLPTTVAAVVKAVDAIVPVGTLVSSIAGNFAAGVTSTATGSGTSTGH